MSDGGYTLAETLVAISIIGMVTGGLVAAGTVLRRQHERAVHDSATSAALLTAEIHLRDLMNATRSGGSDLRGAAQGFTAVCGVRACGSAVTERETGAKIITRRGDAVTSDRLGTGDIRFVYSTRQAQFSSWPSGRDPNNDLTDPLTYVTVQRDGRPLITEAVPDAITSGCQFDVISRTCRGEAS